MFKSNKLFIRYEFIKYLIKNTILFIPYNFINYLIKKTIYISRLINIFYILIFGNPIDNSKSSLVLSLTSMPERIDFCWISIISLFNQNFKNYKVVLTLSLEEFPKRNIPWTLKILRSKGLEILWCKKNFRSFKKLLPIKKKYPDSLIVTFDDDVYYEPWRLKYLIEEHKKNPGAIIGFRGYQITFDENRKIKLYKEWERISKKLMTKDVFLTGVGGIIYPKNKMFDRLIQDYQLAQKLTPNGDDIFFWAIANSLDIDILCLGFFKVRNVFELRKTRKLFDLNKDDNNENNNDKQLKRILDYFKINF